MIKKKILFITGAGASVDFGLPIGQGLIDEILNVEWKTLYSDNFGIKIERYELTEFQKKLRLSNTPSIDIFIANNPEYVELSKALIAKIIGEKEKQAFGQLFQDKWLRYIWHKMVDGCRSFNEFKKNNACFLTFNYDRILETFFVNSIANFFNITTENEFYKEIFGIVPIIHVFGKVGNLPTEHQSMSRDLKDTLGTYPSWKDVGQELKTIYETQTSKLYNTIKEVTDEAAEIYFIGFGYNTFNLRLLGIQDLPEDKYISGSRYNISNAEIEDINVSNNNKLRNLDFISLKYTCYEFLKNDVRFFAPGKKNI